MANRTCSLPECSKPHRARGLCATHYNHAYQPDRHRKVELTCAQCGDVVLKEATGKFANRFCSLLCRDIYRNAGRPTYSPLPLGHPVLRLARGLDAYAPRRGPKPVVAIRALECDWCGAVFSSRKTSQRMCSYACKRKAAKVRRRGQAKGWVSHYTWAEVMHLFLALGKSCAYCTKPIEGQPDPDHVVPLSRGGSNSITNILPCCGPCNSDKRDLLLGEWNADRAHRNLPPRTVSDPRWTHLTSHLSDEVRLIG